MAYRLPETAPTQRHNPKGLKPIHLKWPTTFLKPPPPNAITPNA